jgi:lipopolysaccharide transport system ATP-binding protein
MKPAIRVENLSKQYRIGTRSRGAIPNLTESITEGASKMWRAVTGRAGSGDDPNQFSALKDVSFDVQPGEVVGIIGRNGAGKSTLLKILSRITEPTSGRAFVRGRMGSLLEVGTGFHPELTGRENVYLNGSILGMSREEIDLKFDEIVDFAEIHQFLDTPVKRYSSGMFVRLAFAVAAHLQPDILVVDEVLAVGDAQFQKKCLGKMGEAQRAGKTVLFVSHNMHALAALCSKCIWLDRGHLRMVGPTASILEHYLTASSANASQSTLPVDLRDRPRPGRLDQKVKFLAIELQDKCGNTAYSFCFGEPIYVVLTMESRTFHNHFIVGLSVRTSDGIVLHTSASDDTGRLLSLRPGPLRLCCTMSPTFLKPGFYSLQIGNEVGTTQDFLEDAVRFEVKPTHPHSKTSIYNLQGHLHFDYQWDQIEP